MVVGIRGQLPPGDTGSWSLQSFSLVAEVAETSEARGSEGMEREEREGQGHGL